MPRPSKPIKFALAAAYRGLSSKVVNRLARLESSPAKLAGSRLDSPHSDWPAPPPVAFALVLVWALVGLLASAVHFVSGGAL